MRFLYTLLIYLLSPLALFFLYRPRKGKKGFGKRWGEHLGFVHKASPWSERSKDVPALSDQANCERVINVNL